MNFFEQSINEFIINIMEQNFQVFRKENPEFKQEYETHRDNTHKFYEYIKGFNEMDKKIVEDYIDQVASLNATEQELFYRQGYKDCIKFLKFIERSLINE